MRKATTLIIILICVLFVFGEPIKSNLAASNISLVESEEPFENPYVTDGLVAMWDAEWNTGTSRHDSHATIWRDCVEGAEVTIENTDPNISLIWEQKSLFYQDNYNGERFPSIGFLLSLKMTEPLCEIYNNGIGTFESVCIRGENAVGGRMYTPVGWYSSDARVYASPFFSNGLHFNVSPLVSFIGTLAATPNNLYLNGILKRRGTNTIMYHSYDIGEEINFMNRGNYDSSVKRIYCIRFYNRELTDSEIQYNYNIDKVRFNLP